MAVDTPARIAILGAGPIGLEAALYARFLGYDVDIYERGHVAENLLARGDVRMFVPFGLNRSTLGLAALKAHDENYSPPADDELLTYREWAERYFVPLSQTDLLSDHVRSGQHVSYIGRQGLLKGELAGHEDRGDYAFRLLLQDAKRLESIALADVVIDATGALAKPKPVGHGGIPAIGESLAAFKTRPWIPDLQGADRDKYAGKHTLVIGAGLTAATNIVGLSQLAREVPGTRVTWLVRRVVEPTSPGPVRLIENDPFPARVATMQAANACLTQPDSAVTLFADSAVQALRFEDATQTFIVELLGEHAGEHRFDCVLRNVGFRPDFRFLQELHVAENWHPNTPPPLVNDEPNFYILGAKSRAGRHDFLFTDGLRQIRDLFRILSDNSNLDLYAHTSHLP